MIYIYIYISFKDSEGYTSLHIAAGYLNTETVETLLGAGADPEEEDDSGRSVRSLLKYKYLLNIYMRRHLI